LKKEEEIRSTVKKLRGMVALFNNCKTEKRAETTEAKMGKYKDGRALMCEDISIQSKLIRNPFGDRKKRKRKAQRGKNSARLFMRGARKHVGQNGVGETKGLTLKWEKGQGKNRQSYLKKGSDRSQRNKKDFAAREGHQQKREVYRGKKPSEDQRKKSHKKGKKQKAN